MSVFLEIEPSQYRRFDTIERFETIDVQKPGQTDTVFFVQAVTARAHRNFPDEFSSVEAAGKFIQSVIACCHGPRGWYVTLDDIRNIASTKVPSTYS